MYVLTYIFLHGDHPFKTSANFHDFWPLPPCHRHSSKMLMKGIFDPYVLWPFDHRQMGTPLPPLRNADVLNVWSLIIAICHLAIWQNLCFCQFHCSRIEDLQIAQIIISCHILFSFSRARKFEEIVRKSKTQNPNLFAGWDCGRGCLSRESPNHARFNEHDGFVGNGRKHFWNCK